MSSSLFQVLSFLVLCLIASCHTKPSHDKRSAQGGLGGFGDFGFGFNFDDYDYPLWAINVDTDRGIGLRVNPNPYGLWDKIKGRFKDFKESVKESFGH